MTTLYRKVGRRYRPVAEDDIWDAWPQGSHLVVCTPGSRLTRYKIDPDSAGLLAAAEPLRKQIAEAVLEKLKARPARRLVTEQQRKAWLRFQKLMGDSLYAVEYAGAQELADEVVELVVMGAAKDEIEGNKKTENCKDE